MGKSAKAQGEQSTELRVIISVNGRPVRIEARVPTRPVRLDELLPVLRDIDDRVIDAAVATTAEGERVSCTKGCSACCRRQPIPVTPPEAFALARLVEQLPEPKRTRVREAFTTIARRLRELGLYDVYMHRDPAMSRDDAKAVARRYLALALACPFLEDDACSIYADRPFVCRQYLVTSAPALCDAPLENPVKTVAMPARFASAMLEVGEALSGSAQYTVPLVLALDYVQAHRGELERRYAPKAAFERILQSAVK